MLNNDSRELVLGYYNEILERSGSYAVALETLRGFSRRLSDPSARLQPETDRHTVDRWVRETTSALKSDVTISRAQEQDVDATTIFEQTVLRLIHLKVEVGIVRAKKMTGLFRTMHEAQVFHSMPCGMYTPPGKSANIPSKLWSALKPASLITGKHTLKQLSGSFDLNETAAFVHAAVSELPMT